MDTLALTMLMLLALTVAAVDPVLGVMATSVGLVVVARWPEP